MLDILCKELNNWDFNRGADRFIGDFTISQGELVGFEDKLQPDQYFRIVGSVFNDGIYTYPATMLKDETFHGGVWGMAIPEEVIELADDIEAWIAKYEGVNSPNMSPYNSESFGGYSYTKAVGGYGSNGNSTAGNIPWQSVFKARLNKWRKI